MAELRKRSKAEAADGSAAAAGSTAVAAAPLNPVTTEFEFMGPYVGPIGVVFGLPVLVWASAYFCRGSAWPPLALPAALPTAAEVSAFLPTAEQVKACFSLEAFIVYSCWWLFQALLYLVVPGEMKQGVQLRDGTHLMYPINGWRCLMITLATAAGVHVFVHPLTWIADNFVQLATASIIFSSGLSIYLYASSFVGNKLLATGGNSGIPIYDFFIGRELNPRVLGGRLDLKYFCELRPGLFLWVVINIAMALRQLETLGRIDASMLIVCALQALYVADSVYCEECILTTMDIIMDGFGFMLAFGDLAWVPFMYSLQARYLADQPLTLSPAYAALCLAVALTGFYVFRAANAQKDTFKKDPTHPSVKDLKCIKTHTGSRLLADGWWGTSRHINYFGDWLLSVGMSLPTGFATPVTYFYPIYFAVLLWHREMRDEHKCAAKYGEAWKAYKAQVPYRIIPYVY